MSESAKWSDYISRDQVYVLFTQACEANSHHADLVNTINEDAKEAANGVPFELCSEDELARICRQIRNGLLKQVENALNEKGLTTERINLINRAKDRIPHMLPGSGSGQRIQYKDVFASLLHEVSGSKD